jgi:ABC-2 type transport system ATP-binding protein
VDASVAEVVARASVGAAVLVRAVQSEALARALSSPGVIVDRVRPGALEVHGLSSREIGEAAMREHIALDELTPRQASLEDAFMALTGETVEYRTASPDEPDSVEDAA